MLATLSLMTLGFTADPLPLVSDRLQEEPKETRALLVRGEKVYVRPGRVIEGAAVLIQDGVIVAVGRDLEAPEGARVIQGKVVCPGFVDAWSSFGLDPNALNDDRIGPTSLGSDAVDGYVDPRLEREILAAGVTAYRLQPAATAKSGGVGAVVRLHPSKRADQTTLLGDSSVAFGVGLARDNRNLDIFDRVTDVDRVLGLLSDGLAYLQDQNEYRHELEEWQKKIVDKEKELEEGFKKAKKDREKAQTEAKEKGTEFKDKEYKEDKKPKLPRYDEDKEVMARVASGELPLVVEVHRALEIKNLLDGTQRFERLRLVLAGATDAVQFAEELEKRHIPVILWPQPLGSRRISEFGNADLGLAAELEDAGVEVILGSGGATGLASRELPLLAAIAIGHGLSPQAALAALTTRPARAFDVGDRIGSLEMGRDADLIVLDGEPFAATTKVRYVVSGGDVVVEGN